MTTKTIGSSIAPLIEQVIDPVVASIRRVARDASNRFSDGHFSDRTISRGAALGVSAVALGLLVTGGLLVRKMIQRKAQRAEHKAGEKKHDKTLKDSFPASDPPASQFFDIPVNRQ